MDKTFIDVRIFNPIAPTYRSLAPNQVYKRLETEKRNKYGERIVEVGKGTFTPMVGVEQKLPGLPNVCAK